MRLNQLEQDSIINLAKTYFGKTVKVILFGSRVYDNIKGGDIDILIDTQDKKQLTVKNKLLFLVALKNDIGEQRIDVILNTSLSKNIIKTAFKTGVRLC